nr:hypothetical protein [Bacteroidota bacterium]
MISSYFRKDQLTANEKKDIVSKAYLYISNADVKQICKNRKFPSSVNVDSNLLSHYILQNSGLEKMLESLSMKEVVALYIMSSMGRIPDVRFFGSIYREEFDARTYYFTFNQNYKDLYKEVVEKLVCKGVLLPAFFVDFNAKSKLEQTYFYFPDEFVKYLPQILFSKKEEVTGIVSSKLLREELVRVLENSIGAKSGILKVGANAFSMSMLKKKLFEQKLKENDTSIKNISETTFLISIVTDLFDSLKSNIWFNSDEIDTIIKICLFGTKFKLRGADVCEVAYDCGILCKHPADNKLFQNTQQTYSAVAEPNEYISDVNGKMELDIYRVPFPELEVLSRSAIFFVKDGKTLIEPSLELITKNIKKLQDNEIYDNLCNKLSQFLHAHKTHKSLYGKRIIHRNLLVAKVTDLSVRLMLEKKFTDPSELVKLTDNYYAFPVNNRKKIDAMLTRAGYMIKEIIG